MLNRGRPVNRPSTCRSFADITCWGLNVCALFKMLLNFWAWVNTLPWGENFWAWVNTLPWGDLHSPMRVWTNRQLPGLPTFFKNSASSPKQLAPYWPSYPLLTTTPLPSLPPSHCLSSGHPGTSVLSCPPPPPPSFPPSRGHLVFKLKFT